MNDETNFKNIQDLIKKSQDSLVIIPFGGCGAVGMNVTLYGYGGTWIMIDCGIGFADERIMPGIDLVVPDISIVKKCGIKVSAVIVTHAHEDHLGAICYLWEELKCPIYATVFAANLLKVKAMDEKISEKIDIREVAGGGNNFNIGQIEVNLVGLTHSIVEMKGVLVIGGKYKAFHTGDWKFDHNPVVGDLTEIKRLKEIGDSGLDALLCDSTNIFYNEQTRSEGDLENALFNVISGKKGRVIVTTFASNIARIQTLYNIAEATGRKLAISGTSLQRNIAIAQKSGYLQTISYLEVSQVESIPRHELLLVATGCQGEPLASIAKMSSHRHPLIKLSGGDTVVFSASQIPTNLQKIHDTMNRFIANGIEVITPQAAFVHVSGHPAKPEVKELYSLLRPRIAIPVHGSPMHIQEHARFAKDELRVPSVKMTRDGNIFAISSKYEGGVDVLGTIKTDFLGIDGLVFRHPGEKVMKERRRMVRGGVIFCTLVLNKYFDCVSGPEFFGVGSFDECLDEDVVGIMTKAAINATRKSSKNSKIEEAISSAVFKVAKTTLGTKPIVKVSVSYV